MAGNAKARKPEKKPKRAEPQPDSLPRAFQALLLTAPVVVVFGLGYACAASGTFHSAEEGRTHIFARLAFCLIAQCAAVEFCHTLGLLLGRWLIGDDGPSPLAARPDEMAVNDPSIPWPRPELLSAELRPFLSQKGQPFFLNHVTARRRCKDACARFGMAVGSTVAVWSTCRWMEDRSLADIGFVFLDGHFLQDAGLGVLVGVSIVGLLFIAELLSGWVQFLRFCEVFDPSERLSVCLVWDVVFHVCVSISEELPVRGWMLWSLADALVAHSQWDRSGAFVLATLVESLFFVVMHLNSPGGTQLLSMANIFIGGCAGGLNVLCTGGRLGFTLGWHFGWNISMGNIYGRSTSGIPISGTLIAVAPHPRKQALHGGVFGPEGGVLSPLAYGLGIAFLLALYGWPERMI